MPHLFPFIATSSLTLCPFVVRLSFLPFHDQTDFLTTLHTHQWPPLVHLTLWSILFHILSSSRSGTPTFWLSCFIHHFIGLQKHCLSAEHPYSGFEQLLTKSLPPSSRDCRPKRLPELMSRSPKWHSVQNCCILLYLSGYVQLITQADTKGQFQSYSVFTRNMQSSNPSDFTSKFHRHFSYRADN